MQKTISEILKERILILDGAMGTMIQRANLSEDDYRGSRFIQHPQPLYGNHDILSLTRPDVIRDIHNAYLLAGADIIETNTFSANRISQTDYGMEEYCYEMNRVSAKLAREAANQHSSVAKPRFACGILGPTNRTASMSPNVEDPGFRNVTYMELVEAYTEQIRGLIDGGVHLLMVETIVDTLNAKAALFAVQNYFSEHACNLPVMVSVTVTDKSGRTLSGQTMEAFWVSIKHAPIISVGLNCAFGAKDLRPHLLELSRLADIHTSIHPNAGLPNELGEYDESPEEMAAIVRQFAEEGLMNIVGGCCGTTPNHITAISDGVKSSPPRKIPALPGFSQFSGLESLTINSDSLFANVGERTNMAGSARFRRLIREDNMEEALHVAREQIRGGAQIIDINVDDGLLDGPDTMERFLRWAATDPEISAVPFMLDSSDWKVLETGLKNVQGKPIINSISLKDGEALFVERGKKARQYGAAVLVMAFDEDGQAESLERKIEICSRAFDLLTNKSGFQPQDIIFDPNIFAISTGIDEHNSLGKNYIDACSELKKKYPDCLISGGVSNLSFSFRGNNRIREAMHSVFLYHAIQAGMDMGIVNASQLVVYDDIDENLVSHVEDALFDITPSATQNLVEFASTVENVKEDISRKIEWRQESLQNRISYGLVEGVSEYIKEDMSEALDAYGSPVSIIQGPLMDGMNRVGVLFGDGKMFLPQVVKSARVMKIAVDYLTPYMEKDESLTLSKKKAKILLATVKGDVHDIGKNIVSVVLECNGYSIVDLGVMVPPVDIIHTARKENVDMIGLSGLITPSLREMVVVAREMDREGLSIPLLIGGATTSAKHTGLKILPEYSGPVIHVRDASESVGVVHSLTQPDLADDFIHEARQKLEKYHIQSDKKRLIPIQEARNRSYKINWDSYRPPMPNQTGTFQQDGISIDILKNYIDWTPFFHTWDLKGKYPEIFQHPQYGLKAKELFEEASDMLKQVSKENGFDVRSVFGVFRAHSDGDDIRVNDVAIPFLRQQVRKSKGNPNYSLADFIAPKSTVLNDWIGAFTVSVFINKSELDTYRDIMLKALADRLAEACTEYIHERIRKDIWGFANDESLSNEELIQEKYQGVRPAPGYPACPDHYSKFQIFDLLNTSERIGTELTEYGAMDPPSSVSGWIFSHPDSNYFSISKIGRDQAEDYRSRQGWSSQDVEKWLGHLIDDV